jgi:hypothetical protein
MRRSRIASRRSTRWGRPPRTTSTSRHPEPAASAAAAIRLVSPGTGIPADSAPTRPASATYPRCGGTITGSGLSVGRRHGPSIRQRKVQARDHPVDRLRDPSHQRGKREGQLECDAYSHQGSARDVARVVSTRVHPSDAHQRPSTSAAMPRRRWASTSTVAIANAAGRGRSGTTGRRWVRAADAPAPGAHRRATPAPRCG